MFLRTTEQEGTTWKQCPEPREGKLVGGLPVTVEKEAGGGGTAEKRWRGWVASIWALTWAGGRKTQPPAPELKTPAGQLDRRQSFAPGDQPSASSLCSGRHTSSTNVMSLRQGCFVSHQNTARACPPRSRSLMTPELELAVLQKRRLPPVPELRWTDSSEAAPPLARCRCQALGSRAADGPEPLRPHPLPK